ncbi:MAG TPA: hypothetical protein VHV82_09700 [Sporichthyaceae bacterium]|jgi:hypothetical protein|nr:hypothetical protein [Sporichthyaceae bacterium]
MKSDAARSVPTCLLNRRIALHWPRRVEYAHDDRLRVGRQAQRPRTSLVALINGGRGPN